MRVLILAGTSEARKLAGRISKDFEVIASLSGATREPLDLGVQTRVGGFGGVGGLVNFLAEEAIDLLVDATHPFAQKMTSSAAQAAAKTGVGHVILQRSGWEPKVGDNWCFVDRFEDVAQIIPDGETVFLGTGRQSLHRFSGLSGRRLLCRVIDPPQKAFPFENGEFVLGRPPFTVEEEIDFFKQEGIHWLVVKNAGGDRSRSKLDAARILGLPVIMQNRSALPKVDVVTSVDDCLAWLEAKT